MQKINELQNQIKQLEKLITDEKTKIKKRLPTEFKGQQYQTYTDLWRDHFDLRIPYNRFFEALRKHPELSIEEAVATVRVRQKTIETLKNKKEKKMKIELMSFIEGQCLESGEGIQMTFKTTFTHGSPQFYSVENHGNGRVIIEPCEPHEKCESAEDESHRIDLAEAAFKLITSY